jgi:hypothetical protein
MLSDRSSRQKHIKRVFLPKTHTLKPTLYKNSSIVLSMVALEMSSAPGSAPAKMSPSIRLTLTLRSDRIVAELAGQSWAPRALVNVTVQDGVVDLWGTITDERERPAIVVAAENAPGVKAVKDHLAWIDAMSGMLFYPSPEGPPEAMAS